MKSLILLFLLNIVLSIPIYASDKKSDYKKMEKHLDNGIALGEKKEYDKALIEFNIALKLKLSKPFQSILYYNKGLIYQEKELFKQALANYSRSIKLNNEYTRAYVNRAYVFAELKQYKKAINDINIAISQFPNYPYSYASRARYYAKLKQYSNAMQDINHAIKLNSNKFGLYLNRGIFLFEQRKYKKAEKDFKKVNELKEKFPNSYLFLAKIYAHYKNNEKALEYFEKAVNYGVKNKARIEKDPYFKNLRNNTKFIQLLSKINDK